MPLQKIIFYTDIERAFTGIGGFLIWLRLFKFLDKRHPRFGVIFNVLKSASKDLFFFVIVFLVFIVAMAQCGFLFFFQRVNGFRSFFISCLTLIKGMMGGLETDELEAANRFFGPLFYIIFNLFVVLILVNMFIAIISEAYEDVTDTEDDGSGDSQEARDEHKKSKDRKRLLARVYERMNILNEDSAQLLDRGFFSICWSATVKISAFLYVRVASLEQFLCGGRCSLCLGLLRRLVVLPFQLCSSAADNVSSPSMCRRITDYFFCCGCCTDELSGGDDEDLTFLPAAGHISASECVCFSCMDCLCCRRSIHTEGSSTASASPDAGTSMATTSASSAAASSPASAASAAIPLVDSNVGSSGEKKCACRNGRKCCILSRRWCQLFAPCCFRAALSADESDEIRRFGDKTQWDRVSWLTAKNLASELVFQMFHVVDPTTGAREFVAPGVPKLRNTWTDQTKGVRF